MPIGRLAAFLAVLAFPVGASASSFGHGVCTTAGADQPARAGVERVWNVTFGGSAVTPARLVIATPAFANVEAQGSPRARAIEYSHGYEVRRKIHVYASIATLPLFVTEFALGQKMYNEPGQDSLKTAHGVVAGAIAGLFGVNTVTGVWNLYESRNDPSHRGRRMAHAIMMLAADAGFVATGAMAPDSENYSNFLDQRSAHRTVALTSMGVATASYLMMLFWK